MNTKFCIATTLGALSLLAATGAAYAASPCKGLSETACSANPACGWTRAYTRKDGKEVAAYCRTKVRPKAETSAAAASADKPKS